MSSDSDDRAPRPSLLGRIRDSVLVRRARAREKGGATLLHARYAGMIRGLILGLGRGKYDEADDLTQETFFRAFRGLDGLETPGKFRGWIAQIARRVFLNHRTRDEDARDHLPLSELPESGTPASDEPGPDEIVEAQDLWAVVDQIASPYRETLIDRFHEDLPVARIAEKQGIAVPLAKYRIRQGRRLMRRLLEERAGESTPDA